jgi:alpha-methylacyl-CoA racemase
VLRERLAAVFLTRTRDEWSALFHDGDGCVAPVLSLHEAPHDPHLAARGTFAEHLGVVQPTPAPRFSATPATLGGPPPLPGQHTEEVLREWRVS